MKLARHVAIRSLSRSTSCTLPVNTRTDAMRLTHSSSPRLQTRHMTARKVTSCLIRLHHSCQFTGVSSSSLHGPAIQTHWQVSVLSATDSATRVVSSKIENIVDRRMSLSASHVVLSRSSAATRSRAAWIVLQTEYEYANYVRKKNYCHATHLLLLHFYCYLLIVVVHFEVLYCSHVLAVGPIVYLAHL